MVMEMWARYGLVMADGVEAGRADAGDEGFAVDGVEVGEGVLHEGSGADVGEAREPFGFVDVESVGSAALTAGDGDADGVDVGGVWCPSEW